MSEAKPINTMSFEEALSELERLVSDLDAGNVPLEESVALYERGAKLKAHCEDKLNQAELKIREITGDGKAKDIASLE